MNFKRLIYSIPLFFIRGAHARADYLKKKGLFHHIGENCSIMRRSLPLYSNLISLGDNVHIASNVGFLTHDITHTMLNHSPKIAGGGTPLLEKIGCIHIGDNVFIGSGSRILYDVAVGNNVIIGAGSLVNKDIPNNSVVAGVPARVIGNFDDFVQKRLLEEPYPPDMAPRNESVSEELARYCWDAFHRKRTKTDF